MSAGPWPARIVWLSATLRVFAAAGCSGGETPLGPADAYLLLAPVEPAARSTPGGLPVVDRLEPDGAAGQLLNKLFADGFAAEMVRTVHLAKQLVRNGTLEGRRYGEPLREEAFEPLCLVVGLEGSGPRPHGLAVARWLRSPLERDSTVWLGLPASFAEDKAAVQTVTGRLAAHAISWVDGATGDSAAGLPEAYRMAMEVIAREWRVGRGPTGAMATTAGTEVQRRLFAEIRENRAVLASEGKGLRPPSELLADPRVAATVIYRLAQQRTVGQAVAAPETYTPFVVGPLPEGVSGAAVLGPIRNFQAKLFTAWGRGVLAGRPPRDIVDLVEAYTRAFPSERSEVLRVFLVTTYLGTVKPGGMSRQPERADEALAEVGTVLAEVVAGKRGLRDALNAPPAAPPAAAPTPAPRRRR